MLLKMLRNRRIIAMALRFITVALFVLILHPGPETFRVQYWLAQGDTATQQGNVEMANDAYLRADLLSDAPIDLSADAPTPNRQRATTRDAQLVYLFDQIEETGWTDEALRAYAGLLDPETDLAAIQYLMGSAETLSPDDIDTVWALFDDSLQRLDWEAARRYVQTILSIQADNKKAYYHLGLMLAVDEPQTALAYLENAATDTAYSTAVQRIQQLLMNSSLDADPGTYYRSLGTALVDLREWPYAERAFNDALEADGLDWFSYAYRGYTRDQRGADGFTDLETAVGLAPNTALPYYFMGLHWRSRTPPDFTKAHDAFSLAYLIEADNPALAIEIGRTFQLEVRLDLARDWYNIAVGLDPDNPEWARVQAAFYADTEYSFETEGFAAIEDAYRLAPDDPDIQASLGRAYFLRGELLPAQELLARAVQLDPQNPRARYYYGVVLRQLGDDVAAALNFEEVIRYAGDEGGFGELAARALSQINS